MWYIIQGNSLPVDDNIYIYIYKYISNGSQTRTTLKLKYNQRKSCILNIIYHSALLIIFYIFEIFSAFTKPIKTSTSLSSMRQISWRKKINYNDDWQCIIKSKTKQENNKMQNSIKSLSCVLIGFNVLFGLMWYRFFTQTSWTSNQAMIDDERDACSRLNVSLRFFSLYV